MKWLWSWSGKCFGYRDVDNLWTYSGKHVGKNNRALNKWALFSYIKLGR